MSNSEPVIDYVLLNAKVRSMLSEQDMVLLDQAVAQAVERPAEPIVPEALLINALHDRTKLDPNVLKGMLASTNSFSETLRFQLTEEELQETRAAVDASVKGAAFYDGLHQDLETAVQNEFGLSPEGRASLEELARGPQPGPQHMPAPPWWDLLDYYIQLNRDIHTQATPEELGPLDNIVNRAVQDYAFRTELTQDPAAVLQANGVSVDLVGRVNTLVENQRRRMFFGQLGNIGYEESGPG